MRLVLLLSFLALAWLAPSRVAACGGTPESYTLLTDAMGRVPAGTKVLKLYVYGTSLDPLTSKVVVSTGGSGLAVAIPVTLRVKPPIVEVDLGNAAIQAGTSYALSVEVGSEVGGRAGSSTQLSFAGAAASPLPTELGQLALEKRASGKMTVGGCGDSEEGEQALIKLVPSAAAEPWLRAVTHQLYVDGTPAFEPELPLIDYVARSSETVVRAIARCDRANSGGEIPFERGVELRMSASEHSVKWTSTFPDGTTLETPAIAVDLRCSGMASAPTPPCCKPLVGPQDAGAALPIDAGVNMVTRVDMGPTGTAQPTSAPQLLPSDVGSRSSVPRTGAPSGDDAPAEQGCSLGRGQRGGAQALALFVVLFLLHARSARRRA